MAEKVLVDIYYGYDGREATELNETYAMYDTPENREQLIEDKMVGEVKVDLYSDFVNGELSEIKTSKYIIMGDGDELTDAKIVISTLDEAKNEAQKVYQERIDDIDKAFNNLK